MRYMEIIKNKDSLIDSKKLTEQLIKDIKKQVKIHTQRCKAPLLCTII